MPGTRSAALAVWVDLRWARFLRGTQEAA